MKLRQAFPLLFLALLLTAGTGLLAQDRSPANDSFDGGAWPSRPAGDHPAGNGDQDRRPPGAWSLDPSGGVLQSIVCEN